MKHLLKSAMARLLRPATHPLHERIERLERDLAGRAASESQAAASTRAEILARLDSHAAQTASVLDTLESVAGATIQREKHREELSFWRWLITTPEGRASLAEPFDVCFGRWQRDRLRELAMALNLPQLPSGPRLDPAWNGTFVLPPELSSLGVDGLDRLVDQWCAERSALEIGGGPYPALAAAPRWKRAVAVDPIARGYAELNLFPSAADHLVAIESPGERIPVPSAWADLIIIENALDHVSDPAAVLTESRRVLREGGLLWLLVDLSTYSDPMHPHPFDEHRARMLLKDAGLEVVVDRVSTHHSHPKAHGEYRALARKIALAPPRLTAG